MQNWTFGRKLGVGFGITIALACAMGVVAVVALDEVATAKDRTLSRTNDSLTNAGNVRAAMQREVANVRAYLLTGHARYRNAIRDAGNEYAHALDRMKETVSTDRRRTLLGAVDVAERAHQEELERALEMRHADRDLSEIVDVVDERVVPRFDELDDAVVALVDDVRAELEHERDAANSVVAYTTRVVTAIAIFVFLFASTTAVVLSRSLSQRIGESVERVRSSSTELAAAANQQASSAQEQATAVTEISTTISELLVTSRQIMESATRVSQIARQTAESAGRGEQNVHSADQALGEIRNQTSAIVEHMLGLGRRSQEIGGILDIINELAEQTNILAINATIEAAGAGEAGTRFAVVGEEIRRLSQRVSGSIREIRGLIDEIRASVNTTVMATETGSKTVDVGTRRFGELSRAFEEIANLVEATTDAAREIELGTRQQAAAVEQLNTAMSDVSQVAKESETVTRDTLTTVTELASLSSQLVRLVRRDEAA